MEKLELSDYLERIATALEESNTNFRQWAETQSQWRDEDTKNQQRVFDQSQEWIDWQKHHLQEHFAREERMNDLARERHEAIAREQNGAILAVYEESLRSTTKPGLDIKMLADAVEDEIGKRARMQGKARAE